MVGIVWCVCGAVISLPNRSNLKHRALYLASVMKVGHCSAGNPEVRWLRPFRPHPHHMVDADGKQHSYSEASELRQEAGLESKRSFIYDPIEGRSVHVKWAGTMAAREDGRSKNNQNRIRQLALVMLRVVPAMRHCTSLRSWVAEACESPALAIRNTDSNRAIHSVLQHAPDYITSEYAGPTKRPGTSLGRKTQHEGLHALSYATESVDLLLSSEVFEHLHSPYAAFSSVYRVLRHGGKHLFTTPFSGLARDTQFSRRHANGTIVHPPNGATYHGNPNPQAAGGGGSLLYTHFGQEMVSSLCSMGYDVNMWEVDAPEMGITGDGALVFEATKPSDQHRSRRRSSGTGCAGQC